MIFPRPHWGIFLLLGMFFTACASKKALHSQDRGLSLPISPPSIEEEQQIAFPAMGMAWKIRYRKPPKSFDKKRLAENLIQTVLLMDTTFSDWRNDSELRKLEKEGLTKIHVPSELFLRGLKLSQKAYTATSGAFDITIGAVQWKERTTPVGLSSLKLEAQQFTFRKDPRRLSFGGLIKGATVGALATKLFQAGLRNFAIDAGGGNWAVIGEEQPGKPWLSPKKTLSPKYLYFISYSHSKQENRQHVMDPQDPSRKLARSTAVTCKAGPHPREWFNEAGLGDALSTALLIQPDLENLPLNCLVRVQQSTP